MTERVVPAHAIARLELDVHDAVSLDELGSALGRKLAVDRVVIKHVLDNALLPELWLVRARDLRPALQRSESLE